MAVTPSICKSIRLHRVCASRSRLNWQNTTACSPFLTARGWTTRARTRLTTSTCASFTSGCKSLSSEWSGLQSSLTLSKIWKVAPFAQLSTPTCSMAAQAPNTSSAEFSKKSPHRSFPWSRLGWSPVKSMTLSKNSSLKRTLTSAMTSFGRRSTSWTTWWYPPSSRTTWRTRFYKPARRSISFEDAATSKIGSWTCRYRRPSRLSSMT